MKDWLKEIFGPQLDPSTCKIPDTPSSCQYAELTLSAEIMNYVFYFFVPFKTICFVFGLYGYVCRYYRTHKTCNQVEIWLLSITAIKVAILLPDYFIREINFLWLVFLINSATTFWLSHVLHVRGCIIHEKPKSTVRFYQGLFTIRILVLLTLFIFVPMLQRLFDSSYECETYILTCDCYGNTYPIQFLLIFFLDALSATIDLIIFIVSPKIVNKSKRLKEARTADIEACCQQKSKESAENNIDERIAQRNAMSCDQHDFKNLWKKHAETD